jgi:autotransporter-associated beta strand protein
MGGGIFIVGGDNGGTLTIENGGSMSGSALTPGGGGGQGAGNGQPYGKGIFLTGNGTLNFAPDTNQIQTYADDIVDQSSVSRDTRGGDWGLLLNGPGTLILAGDNTYSGGTVLNEGILSISSDTNLGAAAGLVSFEGGTLVTTAPLTSSRNMTLNTVGGILQVNTVGNTTALSGIIAGSGSLTKTGTGTLTLAGDNTYSGGTVVNDGIMQGTLPQGTFLTVNGGTYTLNSPQVFSSLSGTGGTVTLGNNSLTINGSTTPGAYNGSITGTSSLIKTGSGTLVLAGNNIYSGGTFLNGGILSINSDANLGAATGSISFDGGALETTAPLTSPRNMTVNTA